MLYLKEMASPCTRTVHPSTMTKRSSLIGKAIVRGESIIIPIASKIFETTISITKNGK